MGQQVDDLKPVFYIIESEYINMTLQNVKTEKKVTRVNILFIVI